MVLGTFYAFETVKPKIAVIMATPYILATFYYGSSLKVSSEIFALTVGAVGGLSAFAAYSAAAGCSIAAAAKRFGGNRSAIFHGILLGAVSGISAFTATYSPSFAIATTTTIGALAAGIIAASS